MTRPASKGHARTQRSNIYDEITTKIIAELEAGRLPWVQPWGSSTVSAPLAMPRNAATDRGYSGINVLILWGAVVQHGFATQGWLTFRQALGLGGNVRKGEHGTTVVYADRFIPDDERRRAQDNGDDPAAIPFLKRFTVFNVAQCEGLPDGLLGRSALLGPVSEDIYIRRNAVRNWFEGKNSPSGENLVILMRHSDLVLRTMLSLADRQDLVLAIGLASLRRQLVDAVAAIDGLPLAPD